MSICESGSFIITKSKQVFILLDRCAFRVNLKGKKRKYTYVRVSVIPINVNENFKRDLNIHNITFRVDLLTPLCDNSQISDVNLYLFQIV